MEIIVVIIVLFALLLLIITRPVSGVGEDYYSMLRKIFIRHLDADVKKLTDLERENNFLLAENNMIAASVFSSRIITLLKILSHLWLGRNYEEISLLRDSLREKGREITDKYLETQKQFEKLGRRWVEVENFLSTLYDQSVKLHSESNEVRVWWLDKQEREIETFLFTLRKKSTETGDEWLTKIGSHLRAVSRSLDSSRHALNKYSNALYPLFQGKISPKCVAENLLSFYLKKYVKVAEKILGINNQLMGKGVHGMGKIAVSHARIILVVEILGEIKIQPKYQQGVLKILQEESGKCLKFNDTDITRIFNVTIKKLADDMKRE